MVRSKRKYDKEFKLMALELIESHKSVREVAEELGVGTSLLYYWRKSILEKGENGIQGGRRKDLSSEEAELVHLKKELREVEIERDILKKAVSIFSKSDGKSFNS
jgi:transposase